MINAKVKKSHSLDKEISIGSFLDMVKDEIASEISLDTEIDAGVIILKPVGGRGLISIPLSGGIAGLKFFVALPSIAKDISKEVFIHEKENMFEALIDIMQEQSGKDCEDDDFTLAKGGKVYA